MNPEKQKEFEKKFRKFKKELKKTVSEQSYPYVEDLFETMIFLVGEWHRRKKIHEEQGDYIKPY